ncbi:MAG: hypothetical protein NUV80_00040 [Candidatus Berkelbacteria bacterium]|nr:hypothetical protein [Candidatus Berkelbacteria bacterium]MCR4306941.1 hypothetical protein [Candidatus Berkelbacteria bacterium]
MSGTRKIFLFVALPLVIIFGAIMFFTLGGRGDNTNNISGNNSASTQGKDCPALVTPVDVSLVTSVLYPGQIRGGDFKPHGGFRLDNAGDNFVSVKAPLDAKVTDGSRYIEHGEIQYMFSFEHSCGLKYRFDHLKTLSAKLQAVVEKLPEAKVGDSRTTEIEGNITAVAGEIVATAVGFEKSPDDINRPNVGFDFGLYDSRQKNESSKDSAWVAAHQEDGDQAIYGVCWLDWLPASDAVILKALSGADGQSGKTSDYCK